MSRKRICVTDEELIAILEEDIPFDDNLETDTELDVDEESEYNPVLDATSAFDKIFETELENIFGEVDEQHLIKNDQQNVTEDEMSSTPTRSPLTDISNSTRKNCADMNTEIEIVNRIWNRNLNYVSKIDEYMFPEGVIVDNVADCDTPTDFFLKLLEPAIKHVCFESNLYATQKGKNLSLSENELLSFVGLHLFMGYHQLPNIKSYWSLECDLEIPYVKNTMTRTRFETILSNLHCNNNVLMPKDNKDKLYKVRPVINILNEQFRKFYHGSRQLSVDEAMIVFKGRSSLKQFNPMKPIKRGYKLWVLADKYGYIKKFDVYQGKGGAEDEKYKDYNLGERVVLRMTEEEWGKKKIIFFDNFFTSIRLLEKLKVENTYACGTIKTGRKGLPQKLKEDKKFSRGEYDVVHSSTGISVYKWKDNRIVMFGSNFHNNQESAVLRKNKTGAKEEIKCPDVVKEYGMYMGGVDHADHLRGLYGIDRKASKWWHRLFFGFIEISFINSYIIYCQVKEKITVLEFRRSVTQGLCIRNKQAASASRKRSSSYVNRPQKRKFDFSVPRDVRLGNKGVHWPIFENTRGRCEMCRLLAIQSRPFSKCSACGVYLCCNKEKNCFLEYHKV